MATVNDFRRLKDVEWRQSYEAEHGIFIAEGRLTIERAVAAGYSAHMVLTSPKFEAQMRTLLPDCDFAVLAEEEIEDITGFHVHRGALAAFRRPAPLTLESLSETHGVVLVLEDLIDHENVGTLFRSAAGLGVCAIVLTHTCADPLYRRSIKTSMGAVFTIPWVRAGLSVDIFDALRVRGYEQWALTPRGETDVSSICVRPVNLALWLGNEANGLTAQILSRVDERVSIPMARDTDSLNVAAAGAIAMWAVQNMSMDFEE